MGFHDAAIAFALKRQYLGLPQVARVRNQAPPWLLRLSTKEGIAEYEAMAAVRLPQAVVDFYAATDLICFLEAAHDCGHWGFWTQGTTPNVNPPIEELFGQRFIIVDQHWHSGSRGCLPLDCGDDPPIFGSIHGDALFDIAPSFSEYIRDQIEGYEAILEFWRERYAANPDLNAWVTALPGFDRSGG